MPLSFFVIKPETVFLIFDFFSFIYLIQVLLILPSWHLSIPYSHCHHLNSAFINFCLSCCNNSTAFLCFQYFIFLIFKIFYLFIFRERGGEGEREGENHPCEKESSFSWLPYMPWAGKEPTTQACALTGNWSSDILLCRRTPNQLRHTGQGSPFKIYPESNCFSSPLLLPRCLS